MIRKKLHYTLATYKEPSGKKTVDLVELAHKLSPSNMAEFPSISEKRSWEVAQLCRHFLTMVDKMKEMQREFDQKYDVLKSRYDELLKEHRLMKEELTVISNLNPGNVGAAASMRMIAEMAIKKLKVLLQ